MAEQSGSPCEIWQGITEVALQLVSPVAPVASLVNNVAGKDTYAYGVCLFALANNTSINSLYDMKNRKVSNYRYGDRR